MVESASNVVESDYRCRKLTNVIENALKVGSKLSESAINCDRVVVVNIECGSSMGVFLGGTFDSLSITFDATNVIEGIIEVSLSNFSNRTPAHLFGQSHR